MSAIHRGLGGLLVIFALTGCSGDATAPAAPERITPKASLSNGISVQFIQQPGDFGIGQSCTWEAIASGGDPYSYTYTWAPGGSSSSPDGGLQEDYSYANYWGGHANSTGWYELTVTVTDAYGRSGSATSSGAVTLYLNPYCN